MSDIKNLHRLADEGYYDYMTRLFDMQSRKEITCETIAMLLNRETGENYGESAYRKFYRAFAAGREYERSRTLDGVATKILSISDLHIPYQLPVETFMEYRWGVDVLILNGDVTDCQPLSKFPKVYRNSPMEEIIETRAYLIELIEYINPKKVIVIPGNHDYRFQNYLAKNLDSDILELMPKTSLELIVEDGFHHYDKKNRTKVWYPPIKEVVAYEVEYIDDWKCKVGRTIFAHPLSYSTGMLKTTEKAVEYFLRIDRDFDAIVLGHTHKLGNYQQGNISMYEQGCCCRVEELHYADGRLTIPQQKGFALICQDKDGNILTKKSQLIAI